ncbi:BRO family protein [Acetobacter senegalensis]|uniref:BRO family protein n=1 Tax=Acetobacter senegalensis TaxID=446692 RepID=UPI00264A5BAA|nr:phage antirepressor KilAC domain-containing protein [Acetobacter senegalensis]MDN7350013.1 BRO family protein [Acetobacter senegalensis]
MQADLFNTPESLSDSPLQFDFEGHSVRVIDRDGALWWALVDVCKSLEIKNPSDAASRLEPDEKMTLGITEGHSGQRGGARFMTIINESGVYALIFSSNKPAAKRFRKWITSVVIPSIRRTGSYSVQPVLESSPAPSMPLPLAEQALAVINGLQGLVAENQAIAQERLETIHSQTDLLNYSMPRAAIHDRLIYADGTLTLSDAAKTIGVAPRKFIALLRREAWIFRRGKSPLAAYQDKITSGYLTHKVSVILAPNGEEKMTEQVRVTPKGLAKLARLVPAALKSNADVSLPAPAPEMFAGHRVEDGTRARYRRDAEQRERQRQEEFEAYHAESEKYRTEYY